MDVITLTTSDGADLEVTSEGTGPDLVLISGLGGTAAFWSGVAGALSGSFRVIRFDQRGIGRSTRGTARVDIDRLADDVLAVLDAAQSGSAILVGHSTGGCIVQAAIARYPQRLKAAVFSASWTHRNRYMREMFTARLAMLRHSPRDYAATGFLLAFPPEWIDRNWDRFDAALAQAPTSPSAQRVVAERIEALLAFEAGDAVAASPLPKLIVGAEDDVIVPAFLQRDMARRFGQATLRLLDRGGHFYPVSRQSEFTALLKAWIEEEVGP